MKQLQVELGGTALIALESPFKLVRFILLALARLDSLAERAWSVVTDSESRSDCLESLKAPSKPEEIMPSITSSSIAPRRLVIVGLGNYTHPQTKHSVGQLLLKNLVLKAASLPGSTGSPHLQLAKSTSKSFFGGSSSSWTTKITIPSPSTITTRNEESLEILFVLPKALMNVCGKTIVNTTQGFLPSVPASPPPSPSPSTPATSEAVEWTPQKKNKKQSPVVPLKPIPKLLVLVDDLDLPPLSTRLQRAGGPKGHNGIRSLISALGGSKEFWRFWIGIGRPEGKERGEGVAKWVLGPMERGEVQSVEWNEEEGRGGEVLEKAWKEILRIGFDEE
ncbi:hypothetical protein JCM3765_003472 [Sporobolomyces pararoseus]